MKKNLTPIRQVRTAVKKAMLAPALLLGLSPLFAQTTLISPSGDGGFENGADFAANGWTVQNFTSANTNKWFVGSAATASAGSNSAYISDNATGTTYNYAGSSSRVLFWRDVTFPAGLTSITLTFKVKVVGEVDYDDLSVFIQNGTTVPATGTQPSSSGSSAPSISNTTRLGTVSDVGATYVTRTYTISAADAGNTTVATTRRLIFYWENDASGNYMPPVSIDEISLVAAPPPPPPANDDAAGAITLSINPDLTCTATTTGTTVSATASADAAPGCSASGTNDDVWYKFVATGPGHRISFSNVSAGTMVAALYTGTPGSLTPVATACGSTTLNATGLTGGATYYVRAYTSVATVTTAANFTICVGTLPPPPANDECAGAIAFPVIPTTSTCVSVTANTQNATQSLAGCVGTADEDVWYSFVCPAGYTSLMYANTTVSGSTDRVIEFFSGTCGNLTSMFCNDDEEGTITGLTPGQTYYFRIYTYGSGNNTEVSVCLKTPPVMTYASSTTTQSSTSTLVAGSVNQQIIRTVVVTSGSFFPLNLTQLDYNTTGSNNPATSITNARVYYTGTSTSFSTTTPFGTAVANPNGTFSVTGSQTLAGANTGTTSNYFWLVYDINCTATVSDSVDAQCTGMVVGGTAQTPTATNPAGSRKITAAYATSRSDGNSTTAVTAGATNAQFVYANVAGTSACSSTATSVSFTVSGTAPAADIAQAKCYYTTSSTFSSAVPFGSAIATPAAGNITFTGSQPLGTGSNYFWLVYDISCTATGSNTLNGDVTGLVVNGVTVTPTGTAPSANAINALITTTQPTGTVNAGTANNQLIRVNLNPCGSSSTLTAATFNITGTTNAADILNAKAYYTSSTTFSTATPFGTAVASPGGSFTIAGNRTISGAGYLWLAYDVNCAATPTNVLDASCTEIILSGNAYTPAPANPSGTRAIVAPNNSTTITQSSTSVIPQGSFNQHIVYATVNGCINVPVTSITFATTGTTANADIAAARVFYTTANTFANAVPFGTAITTPGSSMTFTGNQPLATGTGYFWLVYDIAPSATLANVVDASLTNAVVNGNTLTPSASAASGTRTIVTPVVNDNASGAITLGLGAGCTTPTYTNVNASQNANEAVGSCTDAVNAYATVWYKFVAPPSGAVRISTDLGATSNTLSDSRVALFSASNPNDYSTFSLIGCDEDGGSVLGDGYMAVLYATGLNSGTTYYVQVGNYGSSTTSGTFCIAVDELSSSMLATANTCSSSYQTPVGTNTGYTGWTPLLDGSSRLIALVRNTAGVSPGSYTVAQNINTGAVRSDVNGIRYLDRNYRIVNSNTGNYDVQLFMLSSEQAALQAADPAATLNALNITRVTGESGCSANATGAGTTSLITQSGSSSAGGVSWVSFTTPGFSNFYINRGTVPLPIVLKDFSGKNAGAVNNLYWETSAEHNFSYFELQRSADGIHFNSIAQVNSDRNSNGSKYAYTDAAPFTGMNRYRLKIVDLDGKNSLSQVVSLEVKASKFTGVTAYPNPVQQTLHIRISGQAEGAAMVQLMDMTGKVIRSLQVQGNTATMDMNRIPAGMYLLKYTDNSHTSVLKITKD
ncbi:BNR-repeat neuraminidase N-terminal domain-containing protein [Taibaiella chishuiensis]|uniref:Putative secreted protein (Por secretion system target) n=1 Tax=Taibaiella chishuiensis TaxID=1434707 RepID=A0A2P8D4C5_9BACT|nr:BNR-repeat neuraminidase N-terminal domain-containing protein [Taibaiella chishuiensis]PSK92066.1 putative secreted protein (Por secretion system target) [Taibaiella chishuiensis]